jgi:beta-lactamase regulating signal transducer with metallopeptidase domain
MVQALCRTFVHSLWQGILFAAIAAIVLLLTKRTSATLRYNILTAVFFLFTGTVLLTFLEELNTVQAGDRLITPGTVVTGTEIPLTSPSVPTMTGIDENPTFLPEKCMDYCTTHASLIITLWFIFFSIKCLQLLISIGYIQRIRFYKTQNPPVFWKDKMKELVLELGIKKTVILLESGIIKIPVVIGFLKPVLLMPLGLLSNLPADEIEAVLLHELAHIRRKDYFVNLIQSFAEAVFFFNPAFLWISSLIREERENCCDDMAIEVTHNKIRFIQALVSFQEYDPTAPGYGMAFLGRKNQLLNRVKRIIHHKNKTLSIMEKSLIACSFTAIILFSFVPAKKVHSTVAVSAAVEKKDTLPPPVINGINRIKMPEVITPVPAAPETIALVPAPGRMDTVPQEKPPVVPPAPQAPTAPSDGYHFNPHCSYPGEEASKH